MVIGGLVCIFCGIPKEVGPRGCWVPNGTGFCIEKEGFPIDNIACGWPMEDWGIMP